MIGEMIMLKHLDHLNPVKLSYEDMFTIQLLEAQINAHTKNVIHLVPMEEKDSAGEKNTVAWKETQKILDFNQSYAFN